MPQSKPQTFPWRWVIALLGLALAGFLARDLFLRTGTNILTCDDGERGMVDTREFDTKYWAYNIELEATLSDKRKFTGKLDPKQLEQLSESLKQANEFRKFLVHSFNACAITKADYIGYETKFSQLDAIARQINELAGHAALSAADHEQLRMLGQQYAAVSSRLSTK
jgi:hypothetical protein